MTLFLETNVTILFFNESDNNRKAHYTKLKKFHVTGFDVFAYPTGAPSTAHAVPLPRGARGRLGGITAYCAALDGYVHGGGARGRFEGITA